MVLRCATLNTIFPGERDEFEYQRSHELYFNPSTCRPTLCSFTISLEIKFTSY